MASQTTTLSSKSREPLVGGLVLIVIGGLLLAAQFVPDISRYVALVIGLGLLGLFALRRDYGLLIAGGVVTGVGSGIVIASSASGDISGGGFLISLGLGFVGIFVISYVLRLSERHWWPLIPGLILTAIGAALIAGRGAVELLNFWPLILIVLGLVMLGRWLFERREAGGAA